RSRVLLVPARYNLSGHAALPIFTTGAEVEIALSSTGGAGEGMIGFSSGGRRTTARLLDPEFPKYRSLLPTEFSARADLATGPFRSEEHTSELQSRDNLVCRLLLE